MCQAGWLAPFFFSLPQGFLEHPHISGRQAAGSTGWTRQMRSRVLTFWSGEAVNKLVNPDLRLDLGRNRKQVWEMMVRDVLPEEVTLDLKPEG